MQASRALEHRRKLYSLILAGKPRSAGAALHSCLALYAPPPPMWYLLMGLVGFELYAMDWLCGTSLELHPPALGWVGHVAMISSATILVSTRVAYAHSRWREGRALWSDLVAGCRNLASNAAGAFTDAERMERLILHTITFAWAVRSALRGSTLGDEPTDTLVVSGLLSDEQLRLVNGYGHAPMALIDLIRAEVRNEVADQAVSNHGRAIGHWDLAINEDVRGLLGAMTGCERVRAAAAVPLYVAPIPFIMTCWLVAYPALLVSDLGWRTTMILFAAASLVLFRLDEIVIEMSEPFGTKQNQLPTDELCTQIEQDLLEIMSRAEEEDAAGAAVSGSGGQPQLASRALAAVQPTALARRADLEQGHCQFAA